MAARRQPKARIVDTVALGQSPLEPAEPKTSLVAASAIREYLSGGQSLLIASYIRALPRYIDDLSRDFQIDIYEQMLRDPQVRSCLDVLKLSALASGVRLTAAVPEAGASDYQAGQEILAFCQRNLDGLETPLVTVLFDMLDCLAFGNRIAEEVYTIPSGGLDAGRLCLKSLKPKPRAAYAFVCDAWNNTLGILGLVPGVATPVLVNAIVSDPGKIRNLLPRSKFLVLSNRPVDGDPRGTSILRPCYNAWWLKQQTWGEYLKYIAQFAGPSVWATTPENAQPIPELDADGNVVVDVNGDPVQIEPEAALLAALERFRSGSAGAFPFGTELQAINVGGEGAPFLQAIDLYDRQIAKAITGQTLSTEQGQYQARAAAQVHQDILSMATAFVKTLIEEALRRDILVPLVVMNFGEEARRLAPGVSLSETEQSDFAGDAAAIASLMTAGYLDPSQLAELDARLGLPARDPKSIERAEKAKGEGRKGEGDA